MPNVVISLHRIFKSEKPCCHIGYKLTLTGRILDIILGLKHPYLVHESVFRIIDPFLEFIGSFVFNKLIRVLVRPHVNDLRHKSRLPQYRERTLCSINSCTVRIVTKQYVLVSCHLTLPDIFSRIPCDKVCVSRCKCCSERCNCLIKSGLMKRYDIHISFTDYNVLRLCGLGDI